MKKLILPFLLIFCSFSFGQNLILLEQLRQQQVNEKNESNQTPQYVASSTSPSSTSSAIDLILPGGIQEGDFILVQVYNDDDSVITTPTGYTEIYQSSGFTNFTHAAFYKIADATDATSDPPTTQITVNVSASLIADVIFGQAHVFRGVDPISPFEALVVDEQDLNTLHDIPAQTTTGADRLGVALLQVGDNRTITTDAVNWTQITSEQTSNGSDGWLLMYTRNIPTATTTTADSVDFDQSENGGTIAIALQPASGVQQERQHPIVLQSSQVPGSTDLTNFPVLITLDMLNDEVVDLGANSALANGDDIIFTSDAAGLNRLPIDIVQFVASATPADRRCTIFVRVPNLSATNDTTIYIRYNNDSRTQPAVDAAFGRYETWSRFRIATTDGNLNRASATNFTGVTAGTTTATNPFGTADFAISDFDGNDRHDLDITGWLGSSGMTAYWWYEYTNTSAVFQRITQLYVAGESSMQLVKGSATGNADQIGIGYENVPDATITNTNMSSANGVAANVWNFAGGSTADNNDMVLFSNGTQFDNDDGENLSTASPSGPTFILGGRDDSAQFFEGRMMAWIAEEELGYDWIEAFYNNTSSPATFGIEGASSDVNPDIDDFVFYYPFQDNDFESTGNHTQINLNGTPSYDTGPNSLYPRSRVFDGTDFFDIAASSDFSVTNFTISFWMYKTTDWSASWQEIVEHGRGVDGNNNWYYAAISGTTANSLTNRWSNNGDDIGRHTTNTTNFGVLDTWYHVIFTVNGTTATTYIDGVVNTETTGITLGTPALDEIRIGAFQEGGEEYVGRLAGLKFWNTGKDAVQALQIYNASQ